MLQNDIYASKAKVCQCSTSYPLYPIGAFCQYRLAIMASQDCTVNLQLLLKSLHPSILPMRQRKKHIHVLGRPKARSKAVLRQPPSDDPPIMAAKPVKDISPVQPPVTPIRLKLAANDLQRRAGPFCPQPRQDISAAHQPVAGVS